MQFNNTVFDVIIIGAGPIGLACGIEAKRHQLRYLILEKGCLTNSIYNFPTNMTFFSTSERLEIGGIPFVSHGDKPTRREALEYYRRVKMHWQLAVKTYEKVQHINPTHSPYEVVTAKATYLTNHIIIATGFYDQPNLMNIEGESLAKVKHYFDDPHLYAEQKIVIVGNGNSAVDVALECYRKGAEVTMVVRKSDFKKGIKYWVRPDIENRIQEKSIQAFFQSELVTIRPNEVVIKTPNALKTIANDFVLAMTGYQPNFNWLQNIGIQISKDRKKTPFHNQEHLETNIPNIYLAGVVCGGMETNKWFIENSRIHAQTIIKHIDKKLIKV